MTEAKQTSPNPQKCSQCPGSFFGFINWQGYSHPACLSCWSLFQDKLSNMQEQNMRAMNQLSSEMEWSSGLPLGTMPRYAPPPPKYLTKIGNFALNNINIDRSAVGAIVTGTVAGNLQNIDATLTLLNKDPSYKEFQKAIKELTEAIVGAQNATKEQKEAVVEWLSVLTEQARSPKESRKTSVVRTAMKELGELAGAVTAIKTIWDVAVPVITQIFS